MTIKRKTSLILGGTILAGALLTGCQQTELEDLTTDKVEEVEEMEMEVEEKEEEIEMSDWDGSWNNMGAYLEDEELADAFIELGEKDGISAEEAKEAYVKRRHADFDGLVVSGDKLVLLDAFEDEDGQVIDQAEYEYKETTIVKHGNFDTEWYNFEAKEDNAKYKTLLMMPVHGEEMLTHFHMRYGNDLDELLAMEDWYPTFVRPNSTYEQLHGEILD